MTDPDPLQALFRQEVAAAVTALGDGLAVLAADPGQVSQLDPLERAARQAKAAAFLVGAGPAAELAGALEEAFAAARKAPGSLTAGRVTDLMAAADALKAVAEGESPDVAAVVAKLGAPPVAGVLSPSPLAGEGLGVRGEALPPPKPDPSPPAPLPQGERGEKPPTAPDPLLDLFREEVRSLTGALSTGLVGLEADPDPRRVEPLMRAAHSIKGAARIVGVDPAVEVAHVMEELLVAVQHGRHALTPDDVDALLAAVDLLSQLGDADLKAWSSANAAAAADRVAALRGRVGGKPAAAQRPGPEYSVLSTQDPPAPPPAEAPRSADASRLNVPPVIPSPPPPSPSEEDRVVRVSAQSLSRLLSLAGESLVEARWLQPFSNSLLKLKKYQDHLADVLDDLARAVLADAASDRTGRAADDARRRVAACRQVLTERIDEFETHARRSDDLNSRLYREVIASRMRPFADGTHGLARMVRDVARQLGKKVRFEVAGQDTDVDRDILDKLEAPLGHILRNALDHGLEPPEERAAAGKPEAGSLRLESRHHAGMLTIRVTDDGRGIDPTRLRAKVIERGLTTPELAARMSDPELFDFLFLPGFSTADAVTEVSGRGVGLDAVQAMAQAVGGTVRITSRPGFGATFELQLPITLSVVRAVMVRIAGDPYALPLNRTDRLLRLAPDDVRMLEGKPHFEADGRHVGLVPAHLIFGFPAGGPPGDDLAVVLIADRAHQYGLIVEGFLGEQDLVVRPLDPRLGKVPNVSAAAVLEDGSPVLIVDVDDVVRSVAVLVHEGKLRHRPAGKGHGRRKRVLVVDDSAIVREVERQMLAGRGYAVDVAVDGADGWSAARSGGYDLVVSDVDMPRMTGLELVRAIRADPKLQSLPVVIVSYKDRDDDRTRGLEVGANYYLTKSSFHDGQFLAAVEDLIGGPEGD